MGKYSNLLAYRKCSPKNLNSVFTVPHVVPKLHDFLSSVEKKGDKFDKFNLFWLPLTSTVWTNKNKISQTEVLQKKEKTQVWNNCMNCCIQKHKLFWLSAYCLYCKRKKNLYSMNVISINVIRCTWVMLSLSCDLWHLLRCFTVTHEKSSPIRSCDGKVSTGCAL